MDRLNRVLTGGTLVLMLGAIIAAPGCHSSEKVPPGKEYPTTGGPPSSLNFNSDPRPNNAVSGVPYGGGNVPGMAGMPGMTGPGNPMTPSSMDASAGGMGAVQPQYGTPPPNTSNYGAPAVGAYNGTMGTAAAPSPYGNAGK